MPDNKSKATRLIGYKPRKGGGGLVSDYVNRATSQEGGSSY